MGEVAIRRLGVMGGTFDPLHVGHLAAASDAAHACGLDRVLFVTAARPWQKAGYSNPEDRFLMTSLGVGSHPSFAASRIELDRAGPTYTADTLQALRDFHGEAVDLFFIVGGDALATVDTWHEVGRAADLAELVAVSRPGWSLDIDSVKATWPRVKALEIPGIDVSGTDIRGRVAAGKPIDFLVPDAVVRFIAERGLYLDAREAAGA